MQFRWQIIISFLLLVSNSFAQTNQYNQFQHQFDSLYQAANYDEALRVAKQMNAWALQNETDTSLRYAVSFRKIGLCYLGKSQSDSALNYYHSSMRMLEHQNRKEHPDYAISLKNLGILYKKMGDYKGAEPYYQQALEIRKKTVGEEHPDYASSLNNLGNLYSDMGDYKGAEPYYKQALEIRKKTLGEDHPDYASSLMNLGILYSDMGDYKGAEPYYKQALEIRKRTLGEEHPEYASSLKNLGILYKKTGDYKGAEPYYKQALEIRKRTLGEEHPDYASSLMSLGILYDEMADYKVAEPYYRQALEIRKRTLGEEHPDYASSLMSLGILYDEMADYKVAEPFYKQALEIQKKTLGEEHPNYASCLNSLGIMYSDKGDYKVAEPYYKKALEIRQSTLGVDHPDYASSLMNLAILYTEMGDYKVAEPYYKHALEIKKKALGEEHPNYASCLNSLGILYFEMGDYKVAEPYYKQALEIKKKTLGEEHPNYASSLNNLGNLYSDMGDYKDAEPYYKQALEIRRKALGVEHPDYASSLMNLGILYSDMDDSKGAEPYYKQALEIYKKTLGEEHPDYASCLNSLGILYTEMGDYKGAEPYCKQALAIRKKALGEEHPDYAISLNNLGDLYSGMGDYKVAEPYYKQALEIRKKALGEEHPAYLDAKKDYAYLLARTNREAQAYDLLRENFDIKSKLIADNFEWLSDCQKEAYWKMEASFYDELSFFANEVHNKVPQSVGLNYNASLISKSKLLETKISSEHYYQEVDELREELGYRKRLIAKMETEGSEDKPRLDKLRHEADSLDKRLTLSWPEYAQQKKNLTITWEQVQSHLEKGEAAIEFVRWAKEDDSIHYYNALVLKKGDRYPTLVPLCKEEDLKGITSTLGLSDYYRLVWEPMESVLKDVTTIYYAPVGALCHVPFAAIYKPSGSGDVAVVNKTNKRGVVEEEYTQSEANAEYLMDRFHLHQLTSTRYLAMDLKKKEKEPIGNSIAMVGGVNYDYLPTSLNKNKDKKENRKAESSSNKLGYLKGTKTEVERIESVLIKNGWQTKRFQNNDATEENVIKLSGKEASSILHLATHGFAYPAYDFRDTTIGKNSLRYTFRYSDNPMVRSGLVLTGGNWAWQGSDTLIQLGASENGILTALEVSNLQLKKTNLVVLSACETGVGAIEGTEGNFGLKRGFKLAGVEQMIVSLWSVPDKETMELMSLFYSDLAQTLHPVESFEKAQKEMRKKYPTEPYKWAGFVLVR